MAKQLPMDQPQERKAPDSARVKSLYVPHEFLPLFDRAKALSKKLGGRPSVSEIFMVCLASCIDTLEKEAVDKRRFKLNGKVVSL